MRRTGKEKAKYAALAAVAGTLGVVLLLGVSLRNGTSPAAESLRERFPFFSSAVVSGESGGNGSDPSGDPANLSALPSASYRPQYILHGGGNIGSDSVTNSLTAVRQAVAASQYYVETDFELTSDGIPVCIHDWNNHFLPGYSMDEFPITSDEFIRQRIYGAYDPMRLTELIGAMRSEPRLCIITDSKDCQEELLSAILAEAPELCPRFIIQIYSISEYERVRKMGFENVILTLYELPNEIKTEPELILSLVDGKELWGITFAAELADREGYVDTLLRAGIPLYVHTVNDADAIASYLAMGITGVYTDVCLSAESAAE